MADDLWSLFYVVIEFLKGNLPWKGKEKEKIGELKIELTNLRLVDDLPASMADLYTYLSKLAYEDRPDYDFIYNCFAKFDGGKGAIYPGCNLYDWEQPKVTSEVVVATASATAAAVVESGGVTGSTSAMGGQDSTVKKMFGNGASSSATVAAAGIGAPSQQGNSSNNFFSHPQPLGSGSSKRMVTRQDSQNKFILSASSSMERIKTAAGVAAADDTMAVDSNRKNDNYLSFQQSPLINDSQSMNRLHHPYNNSNQEFNQSYDSGLSQMAVNTVTSGNNNNTMASRSCLNLLSSSNNNNNNGFSFQPQLQHMDSALSTPVLQSPFTNSPINAFYSSQQHGSQPSLAEFAAGKLWVDGSRGVGGGAGGEVMMDVDIEDEEEDKMLMKSDNRHGDNKFSNFGHQEDNNSEDKSLPSINRSRSPEFPRQFQEEVI